MYTRKERQSRTIFGRTASQTLGRTASFTIAPLAIIPLMAWAQVTDRADLDPQTSSANRAFEAITIMGEQEAQKMPWATQTDRKTLDDRQILNWSQLGSRAEPGVNFSTNTKSINIRGLDQTRVLTRIDGIRQPYLVDIRGSNGGVSGGLNAIDFNSVSGIDIVRGSDSSTVGSGAMGGVVDVRSLSPEDLLSPGKAFSAFAKTGYYSVDSSWLLNTAAAGQGDNGFKWLVQAGVQLGHETQNMGTVAGYGPSRSKPNPDSYTQQNYQLKLQQAFDGGHLVGLTGTYFDRQDDISSMTASPRAYAPGQSKLNDKTKRQSVALNYAWAATDNKSLLDTFSAQAYWQSVEVSSNLTAKRLSAPVGNYQRSNTLKENSYGLNLDASKSIGGDISQRWQFGGDWYGTNLTQYAGGKDGCTPRTNRFPPCSFFHNNQSDIPKTTGNQYALWAQNTVGFAQDSFTVTPAIRYDYYQYSPSTDSFAGNPTRANLAANSGQAWSPKLLATWSATKEVSFYAQYALSFNAPSATQLYSRFGSPGTYLVSGNPSLKPEKGRGWELGTKLSLQSVSSSLTFFDNRYDNFIESVSGPGTAQYPFFVQSFKNLENVRIYGVEARGEWRIAQGWRTFASMAWTVGKDQSTGRYLNSVAPLQAIVGVGYSESEWGATAQVSAAAARTNVANPTASRGQPYPDFQAPGYGIVDLTAYWRPASLKGLSIQAGVFNVFNKTYWNALDVPTAGAAPLARPLDAYTQPGRNFAVSLTYQY